ncbi:hypothetical protein Pfo_003756 [Paulownia fortunei]|nr:hypothetical protein Pfo_003756 [Paulownia fortunei]
MLLRNAVVPLHAGTSAAFFIIILFVVNIADSSNDSQAKTCVVENCNTIGIRYGKYCGAGWTGCPGERPCDDLDACCQIHDQCVTQNGLTSIECHEECKRCINKVEKSGKVGFSNNCPYEAALPTLLQCMDMSILFSQFDSSETEL